MAGKHSSTFDSRPKDENFIYLKIVTEEEKTLENQTLVEEIPADSFGSGKVEYVTSDTLCFARPDLHEKVIFTRQAKEKITQNEWNGIPVLKDSRFDIPCSSKQNELSSRLTFPKIEGRKAPGANRVLPLITSVWEDNDTHRKRQKVPKISLERQHAKGKISITSRKNSHGSLNLEEENEEWLAKWDFDDLGGSIYRAYTDFFMSEEVGESREDCICSECGMEFLTATHVAHHLEDCHNKGAVKLHQCFVCRRKRYPSLLQLNQHLSKAHGIPRPQLTCRTCFMELVGESEAKAHSRKHQTPYKCPRCPLSQSQNGHSISVHRFATQFLLSEHLREVHLPLERPFSCPICGRHFIHEFVRNLHLSRRHTNLSLICPEVRPHFSSPSLPVLPSLHDLSNSISSGTPQGSNTNSLNILGVQEDSIEVLSSNQFSSVSNKKMFERLPFDSLDLQIVYQQKTINCSNGNFMFPDDVSLLRHVFKCHEKEVRMQLLKWAKEADREDTLFEKLWNSYLNVPKKGTNFKISVNEEVKSALQPASEMDMEVLVNTGRISLSFRSPNEQPVDHHLDKMAENVYTGHDSTVELAHVISAQSNQSSSEAVNPIGSISSSTILEVTNQSSEISTKLSADSVSSLTTSCVLGKRPLQALIPAVESISNSSDILASIQPAYSCLLKPSSHLNSSEVHKECLFDYTEISDSVKSCLMDVVKVVCDVFDEGSSIKHSKNVLSQSSPQKAVSVRCLLCRYLASSAMGLERHRRRRHFRNKHCPFCSLSCQSIEAVGRHVLHSHLNSLVKDTNDIVSKEGSKEPEESEKTQTQKMVQSSSGLRCPVCKKIFSSRGKCNSHQETVHKMEVVSRPLKCDICSKKFQFQKALERHQLLHGQDEIEDGNQNLYSCPHCDQTFLRPGFLERHIASHFELVQKDGKGTFGHLCKYCKRRLPTQAKLKAHLRTSHPPSHLKQRFVCNQCPVKCNTASGLRVHMRVHTGERPYNCSECSMSFKRKTALRKHMVAVHTSLPSSDIDGGTTFLQCSDCSSSFRDRSNLVRHFLQVHRGLRRFVCGVCGAKYAQNQDLRRHLKASHDVNASKIIGSDRRSADQIYVVPPLADDLPQDHPLVSKICAIVEEEEQKLNEDNLPNFTETPQLHLHIHKEPVLNVEKASKSSKGKDISIATDNLNMNPNGSISYLMDSVKVSHIDGSTKIQGKSISMKGIEQGRFVKVDLKASKETRRSAREKSSEDENSPQSQRNLILDALISTQIAPDAIQLHGIASHSEQSLLLNQVLSANHIKSKGFETNPYHMNEMNIVMTKELPVEEEDSKNEKVDSPRKHETKDSLSKDGPKSKKDAVMKMKKAIPGDFICCQCGKEFLDAARLERHTKIHTDLKPHVCAVCGKSFVEKYNLKVHMRSHTGERPYKCEVCGKSMRYLKEINDHRRMHLGEKPHVCDICSRAFLRLRDLQRHVQIHLNIKKHRCPICNKAFSRLDHLRTVHMRVHEPKRSAASKTSEKSKSASGDSGGVSESKSLGEKWHSNKQENFSCEKCSKSFSTKAKLEKHLVLHSGHKAYKCSTCSRSFALASYLSAHQKTHEKQQAYLQCPKCPRRFVSQETLSIHEEKFHQRIEKMKKFQTSDQSLKVGRSKDLNLDICDEERFFMTRAGEFDVNLDLEEEMSIQEVLFEPTSLSDAEKNNTFVYLHVISDDLQLTNENSLPE